MGTILSKIVTKAATSLRKSDGQALAVLLELYQQRPDLQEVYPEAQTGNYARLIDWAAGVAGKKWKDSSYPVLRKYASWYRANFTAARPTVTWDAVGLTSSLSANPLWLTLQIMQEKSAADISDHLPLLSLIVTEFKLKNIVELGVRTGNSTLVLLEAARMIAGQVTSVDVEPCLEAREKVKGAGFGESWQFIQGNDLEIADSEIPRPIDLLFIDTNHLYDYTTAEFRKYSPFLRENSWIALHDYVSFPGVTRATQEFLQGLPQKAKFFPFVHQNGLALIRLNLATTD